MLRSRKHSLINWRLWLFLLPAFALYATFMIFPLLDSLRVSAFQISGVGKQSFVGLGNYVKLFSTGFLRDGFFNALVNNVLFFAIHMTLQNPIGLFLAVLLTRRVLRLRSAYRAVLFLPAVLSVVIVGFMWKLIISPLWGIASGAMGAVGLGSQFAPWLGQENTALIAISLMSVWQWVGIPMLLFSAALVGIPETTLEAARVDGASEWMIFWKIQLPMILPTVGIVSVLTFVGNFNAFDMVYAVQSGLAGPNYSTDLLATFFYRTFFGFNLQMADPTMGATVAGSMLMLILLGVGLYFFVIQRRLYRDAVN